MERAVEILKEYGIYVDTRAEISLEKMETGKEDDEEKAESDVA